jgi:hypothetical protein
MRSGRTPPPGARRRPAVRKSSFRPSQPPANANTPSFAAIACQAASAAAASSRPRICWIGLAEARRNARESRAEGADAVKRAR